MTNPPQDNNPFISIAFTIVNLLCLGFIMYGLICDAYIYVWIAFALAIFVLTIYTIWKNLAKKANSPLSKKLFQTSTPITTNYFNEYVNEELFNNINASIHSFEEFFYALIFSTDDFYNWLSAQSRPMPDEYDVHHSVRLMMMADIQSGFKSMYCSQDMTSKEGLAKYMLINFLDKEEYIEYKNIRHISKESLSSATDWGITASNIFNKEQNLDKLVLSDLLQLFNKDLQLQYLIILYRFFSIAAKADGVVTPDETVYLGSILEHARNIAESEETLNKLLEVKYSNEGKKSIHITHRNNYNFKDIARWVVEKQEIDILEIQHKFSLEHYQTLKIIDKLEKEGIVSQSNKEGIRFVLVSSVGQLERQWDTNSNNSSVVEKEINAKSNLSQLNELIGLNSVKKDVQTLSNYIKIQQEREKNGLKSSSVSYHCVFTGNPGTGKTTVARILAKIYKDLGVVNKGHLVETDRAGLVAEYVGQTAVKTNKIIDSALDGVLFIDEAYSLAEGGSSDYGSEAIATLLKRMEDDRDRLIVIVAGYTENMKHFINSNPGLQSRFTRYIEFPDYSAEELMQIFEMHMRKYDYHFGEGAKEQLRHILDMAIIHKDENFGNGRFVRNVFESILQRQADRLASMGELTSEQLSRIEKEDLADL
jgi:SpoVK/Ycf46/Vps4 family AAA+-type ATPase